MPEASTQVDIPKRALFKAAEVCELAQVQPYVLRSWEAEFPELGVAKMAGGPRTYRREDVEQVLKIKHLLLVEGLTLAGARRKLEDDVAPVAVDAPAIDELIGENARERITAVKVGLKQILDLLMSRPTGSGLDEFRLAAQVAPAAKRVRPAPAIAAKSAARAKAPASRGARSSSSTATRRKRA